jgi:formylglycine-generating enzyme required for sulfatase activity
MFTFVFQGRRTLRIVHFIAVTSFTLACFVPAHAEKRVALVIGNDRYVNLAASEQLQKAVNDAHAVGAALKQLQFDVMSAENAGRQDLVDKLDTFTQRLTPGDTAFFFFSGHGVAIAGVNYILPSDIPNIGENQEGRLTHAAFSEQDIVADLKARGVRVAVLVLDACRNNPFAHPGTRGVGGTRGLAPPLQVSGVFSLYSAANGQTALDRLSDGDPDPNSVFSRVLVPRLTKPGLDLRDLAYEVREEVARIAATAGHDQRPASYDETSGGRIYLAGLPPANGGGPGTTGVPPTAGPAVDEGAWSIVKDTTDTALLRRFVEQYAASPHRREAEERLKTLGQTNVAAALPARPAKPAPSADGPSLPAHPAKPAPSADGPCSGPVTASFSSRCAAPLTAVQERGLKPKDSFKECTDCPEMVVVPKGKFTMGSSASEKQRESDEGPQHVVTIGGLFAVGKYHVTVDQFAVFANETRFTAHSGCDWRKPGFTQDGSHPVVCVSWDDANAYAKWLTNKTGRPYRLPSEAEFEYAARAGATTPFWWGSSITPAQANYDGNYVYAEGGSKGVYRQGTVPAGSFDANQWGLYNVHGNAWQWTADCYHDNYNGAPADGSVWTSGSCTGHAIRGGAWGSDPKLLRAAHRLGNSAENFSSGFRLARTLTP